MARRNQVGSGFIIGLLVIIGIVIWLSSLSPIVWIVVFGIAILGVTAFFIIKNVEILPRINVSDEIKKEITNLVDFVYQGGFKPESSMPSKKYQHNILCQIYAWESDIAPYENFVHPIFEKTIQKINTYKDLDNDELCEHMRFAFGGMCKAIIDLTKDKSHARKHFSSLDNLSDRLVQINTDKFKKLFYLTHGYHFWYVYNQDDDYKYFVRQLKNRLKLYHGIKQSDFYKNVSEKKDDVSYTLYFAEKAGEIIRKEVGRTYRLYLPEDNPDEIPPYEYSSSAASDSDFNYRKYWKDIEKTLKKNDGILQTEFYKKFDWSSELLTRALRDAEKDGKVIREKKGNTYILHLPK
jgi:hypothetical protein